MPVYDEPFNQSRIDMLHQVLLSHEEQGNPIDYEIWVDDLKVISRTDDPAMFHHYVDFVNADTKSITVTFYNGDSRSNDKRIFRLKSESTGLQGLENTLNEKLNSERQKWKQERLEEKHSRLKAELKEANDYIDELEQTITTLKKRKFHLGNLNLGELGAQVLEGFMKRNPHLLPGGDGLAGNLPPAPLDDDSEVTIIKGDSEKHPLAHLLDSFSQEEQVGIQFILERLKASPGKVQAIAQWLAHEQNENEPNHTQDADI